MTKRPDAAPPTCKCDEIHDALADGHPNPEGYMECADKAGHLPDCPLHAAPPKVPLESVLKQDKVIEIDENGKVHLPTDAAPVAWMWSRLQRPRYDFPVDWQVTRYRENVPPATHVRSLVDAHPEDATTNELPGPSVVGSCEDAPGGPWEAKEAVNGGWFVWRANGADTDTVGPLGLEAEAVAVRDALNRHEKEQDNG